MNNDKKIHILIASDFSVFRIGLKSLLEKESTFLISGEANNLNEIFNQTGVNVPDVIILNFDLQPDSLISLCQNIHLKYPKLPILLYLNERIDVSVADLIISGVRGIIWKENNSNEFIEAIQCLAIGGSFFEDPKNCKLNCHLSHKLCEHEDVNHLIEMLTNREKDVLKLIGRGLAYKEIAKELEISSRTVESHKNHIMAKLHLNNKYELIRFSIEYLQTE